MVGGYLLWAHRPGDVRGMQIHRLRAGFAATLPQVHVGVASIRISAQFSVQVTQVGIVDVERWPSGDAVCQCVSGLEMTQRRPGVCASGLLQQVNKRAMDAMDGMNGRSGQVQKKYMYIPPRYLRWSLGTS